MKKTLSLILSMLMLLSVFSVTAFAAEDPALKDIKSTFDGVELTWSAVKDAANYIVYRAEGVEGSDTVIATTTATKYVDKSVSEGVSYTYKVTVQANDGSFTTPNTAASLSIVYYKPVCAHAKAAWVIIEEATVFAAGSKNKVCSECNAVVETASIPQLVPETPAIRMLSNTVNGMALTWNAVDGAASYYVYRRAAGENWKLYTITTKTGLTDTTTKSGTYYRYTVRAYNAAGLSVYEPGKLLKYVAAPTNLYAGNTTGGIYVSWNAVEGATAYRVYRKNVGDENWTYLGYTSKTNYADLKVTATEDYIYTVRAISDGIFSNFYVGPTIRRLENPKLVGAESSKEGIITSWEDVAGASGYYVYRKTAGTTWTMIGKVNNTRSTAYLDKSTVKGVTYTYTVRAYSSSSISSYYVNGTSCKDLY